MSGVRTAAAGSTWSVNSSPSTSSTDTIIVCGGTNQNDTITANTTVAAFAISTNGTVGTVGSTAAACEYFSASSSFSYTSGTALLSSAVTSGVGYVLGIRGFIH